MNDQELFFADCLASKLRHGLAKKLYDYEHRLTKIQIKEDWEKKFGDDIKNGKVLQLDNGGVKIRQAMSYLRQVKKMLIVSIVDNEGGYYLTDSKKEFRERNLHLLSRAREMFRDFYIPLYDDPEQIEMFEKDSTVQFMIKEFELERTK